MRPPKINASAVSSGDESMADPKFAAMAKQLMALHDDKKYAAFLRQQSLARDHSFLLAAIKRSDLHPSVRKVLEELITGKLRRRTHRPKSEDVHIKGLRRALWVLDIEAAGCNKRDSAIEEAKSKLRLSYSTIEKAVLKYEAIIKSIKADNPEFIDNLRAAFK